MCFFHVKFGLMCSFFQSSIAVVNHMTGVWKLRILKDKWGSYLLVVNIRFLFLIIICFPVNLWEIFLA